MQAEMRGILLCAALAASPVWAAPEAPPIRPGLWEFSMVGMPHRQSVCLKPDMVKDIKALAQRGEGGDCKVSDEKSAGTQKSFKVSCTTPHKYESLVTMNVLSADHFSMQQDYTLDQGGRTQKGSLKIDYKRLRDC
jgi:hypothetical protein